MCLHKSVDVTLGHARYEHIVWHHLHDMQIAVQIVGALCQWYTSSTDWSGYGDTKHGTICVDFLIY